MAHPLDVLPFDTEGTHKRLNRKTYKPAPVSYPTGTLHCKSLIWNIEHLKPPQLFKQKNRFQPIQFFQLFHPTVTKLNIPTGKRHIFPLRFRLIQFVDHTLKLFDCPQLFAVALNCWHYGQMMSVQSQKPTMRLEICCLPSNTWIFFWNLIEIRILVVILN